MKKLLIPIVLVFVVVAAGTGGYLLLNRPTGAPDGPVGRISFGTSPWEFSSLVWVAQHEGYLAKGGVDFTLKEYASGVAAMKGLLAGEVDVAATAEFAFLSTIPPGGDFKILASIAKIDDIELVGNRERGIEQLKDLKGKRVGLVKGSQAEFFLGRLLTLNHLSVRDIEIVDVKLNDLGDALISGSVDAVVCWQPYVFNLKKRLGTEVVSWPAQGGQNYFWLLVTTKNMILERPAVLEKFLKALIEAEHFTEKNIEAAQEIVQHRTKNERPYLQVIWPRFRFTVSLDQALLVALENEARWMMREEMSKGARIPNYLDSIYFNSLEAVKPERVKIVH